VSRRNDEDNRQTQFANFEDFMKKLKSTNVLSNSENECINLVRKIQSPGVEFLCQDASMYNQAIQSSEMYYRRETSMCSQQEATYVEPEQKPGKMNPNHFNGPSNL
jgi:hypothetical protein